MRSPWTALRTSQEQIRNETDERAELVQLRRRCLELQAVVVAGGSAWSPCWAARSDCGTPPGRPGPVPCSYW